MSRSEPVTDGSIRLTLLAELLSQIDYMSSKVHADPELPSSVPQLPSSTKRVEVRGDGMEQGLIKQIEKMNFRTQMEVFYTAYSKVRCLNFRANCLAFV